MISRFFIDHPRFSFVISIVIVIAGLVGIFSLPVTQYPNITPSQISVSATYPGADAEAVQHSVIEPLEAQINGVKDMLYISSTATNNGSASITVTFDIGTDGNTNTVNTQNRVNWATASLPEEVKRQSVIVKERSSNMLQVVALYSPNGTYDSLFLNNYASIYLKDELARIPGVGDVMMLGELKYSMRVWVNPEKLAFLNLSIDDVINAVKAQNVQTSAGALGDSPSDKKQSFRYTLQTQGRLTDVSEFENIIIYSTAKGEQIRLKDVARIELGSESYGSVGTLNGKPAALLSIYQLNSANGLSIAKEVDKKLKELQVYFPEDLSYEIPFNTTDFISASVEEVVVTLIEAVLLVILVTYIFLQDWRSTLIPTIAIPVSLIGTFGVMLAIGFTINMVTLFGLILAIGVVVDDAIVVIENVNRLMNEEHLSPRDAAIKSMEEVTGPVIATTLVLLAMFIPVCFLPGITGEMYRQFGITISVAVSISSINALTLSPALSAILLKPIKPTDRKFILFRWFDAGFEKMTWVYGLLVSPLVKHSFLMMIFYAGLIFLCYSLYQKLPTGFIPDEDQGVLYVNAQLPDAAAYERTKTVTDKIYELTANEPGVKYVLTIPGFSILTNSLASNCGTAIICLNPWKERESEELQQNAIMKKLSKKYLQITNASLATFGLPPIQGVGSTGGFSFVIEDTTGANPERLANAIYQLSVAANQRPELRQVYSTFTVSTPQVFLDINKEKAMKLNVSPQSINSALQGFTGQTYINDFNKYGKIYHVQIQADQQFRSDMRDLRSMYVKSGNGEMVPLGTLMTHRKISKPQYMNRFNLYSSATINGQNGEGYSSGQAMNVMESLAKDILPPGMKYDWTDMSYQEKIASKGINIFGIELNMMFIIFGLALLFMYLFLVAQYESWMLPVAVLLAVPIAFLGALLSLYLVNLDNNIYTQVGFVLLFGIACKTAILIVEYAKIKHDEGMTLSEAALFAAKLRFRAVLMTAVSFVLGTLPLVIAIGAGASSRRSLGTAVFGGMLLAVVVGTILIPSFFVFIQTLVKWTCFKKSK